MGNFNVFITRLIPKEGIELLEKHCSKIDIYPEDQIIPKDELILNIKNRDGLLCNLADRIDKEVIKAGNKLKGISNLAVGYNNIDIEYATEHNLMVSNTPGVLTDATADLAWTLLFSVARNACVAEKFVRSKKWNGWGPMQFLGADVTNRTLGIIGAGRIGTSMALKSAGFNMKVLYTSNSANTLLEEKLGARKVQLDELLKNSDFISLHVPLNNDTFHLLDAAKLSLLKETAILINTSRGQIIDESALVKVLKNKKIAGAGLDVYEFEPKITEGLYKLDNVVLLPHIGSATHDTRRNMSMIAAKNLISMMNGERPEFLVNPKAIIPK